MLLSWSGPNPRRNSSAFWIAGESGFSPAVSSASVTRLVVPVCARPSASAQEPSARCRSLRKRTPSRMARSTSSLVTPPRPALGAATEREAAVDKTTKTDPPPMHREAEHRSTPSHRRRSVRRSPPETAAACRSRSKSLSL